MFDVPLVTNLFIVFIELEHLLKTSKKRTHIPLLINLFIVLIGLKPPLTYLFL